MLAGSVRDKNVQAAQSGDGVLYQLPAEGGVPDIAGQRKRLAAGLLDELHDFSGVRFFRGQVADGDIRTFTRICDGCGATNAGSTTRMNALRPASRPVPI